MTGKERDGLARRCRSQVYKLNDLAYDLKEAGIDMQVATPRMALVAHDLFALLDGPLKAGAGSKARYAKTEEGAI